MVFPAPDTTEAARLALRFPERTLSYGELQQAVARTAAMVAGLSRVAVIAEPRIETCVAVLAALQAGAAAVPINPRAGVSELGHVASDAAPEAVIAAPGSEIPDALGAARVVAVDLEGAPPASSENAASGAELPGEAPALIVYTSGTTGPPKGVVIPRRAITSNLDALASVWEWGGEDVIVHGLPLFHVHGLVLGILGPLSRGGTARHLGRFSPEALAAALEEEERAVVFGVPTMYRRLAEAAEGSDDLATVLRRARRLVSGSAALPSIEHERLERLTGRPVIERYGMTETLMNTAVPVGAPPRPGYVGPPVPGVEVQVVDDDGRPVAAGDEETLGEVEVRGPNLFLEYRGRPDATAAAFRDGWFRTGDLAVRSGDGWIRLVGRRASDLIKSGGYKIGAGEIEVALREHPAVEDAAVTAESDPDLGERVVAWIVLRAGARAGSEELVEHVAAQLAPHKRPRVVNFLDELPRNELGKVQKARLRPGLSDSAPS